VALERVRHDIGLPAELITYCLLAERSPKVIPCGAWLYSTWQVPVTMGPPPFGAAGGAFRLEEIKTCIGREAFVTVYRTRSRRTAAQLDGILPARDLAASGGSGRMLVALTERIAEVYLSAAEAPGDELLETPPHPAARVRSARIGTRRRLRRQLMEHASAVAHLGTHGARWLDAAAHARLEGLARRLDGLYALIWPELTDPDAS
jgi:hypothetical protein